MFDPSSDRLPAPVLIAGFGSIGRRHRDNLIKLGYRRDQIIFYRTNQSTLPDADISGHAVTQDLHEALSQKPVMAIIANPTARHLEVALAAARAGCHLFIEKPLSHSLERCQELANAVRERRLTTMIGCQFRFHLLLISLRKQIQTSRIGQVKEVQAEWGEYLPDWHPWEDYKKSYSARSDLGGGVVLTLIHPLDYLYWLFGPGRTVEATLRDEPSLQTEAEDDWADITLEFDSGPIAQVHLDFVQKPPVHRLSVSGDGGRATLDFHAGSLEWDAADGQKQTETVPAGFERNTMFVDEMKHFLQAVQHGKPSGIPLEDGIEVLKLALDAKRIAQERALK